MIVLSIGATQDRETAPEMAPDTRRHSVSEKKYFFVANSAIN